MLRDLRELLDEDDQEYPTPEELRRRNILLAAGVGGGVLVLVILCVVGYSLLIAPRLTARRQTQVAANETQIAAISLAQTPSPAPRTPTATPPRATSTPQATPTETLPPTDEITSTPVATMTVTPPPTEPPSPTALATTTPQVIFDENFEGSGGAWPNTTQENYAYGISQGQFRIFVNTFFADIFTVRQREFTGVRLEIDVSRQAGPPDAYAGLICNFQDSANYYAFIVDGDRGYRIFRKSGGVTTDLGEPGQSAIVATGETVNRIRADCNGGRLTMFVNGALVLETQDDTFAGGQVGLLGGTLSEPGLEVLFDNFIIANP